MKRMIAILSIILTLSNLSLSIAQSYEYDKLNRLTKVIYDDGNTMEYIYDEYGNIIKITKRITRENNIQNKDEADKRINNREENNKEKETTKTESNLNKKEDKQINEKDNYNKSDIIEKVQKREYKKEGYIVNKNETNPTDPKKYNIKFKDIKDGSWYSDSVNYVVNKEIMIGVSKENFAPDKYATRAMITQILYRLSKAEKPKYKSGFKDIENDKWYTNSIIWASQNGLIKGKTKEEFKPNDVLTREQLITILYNFVKLKEDINQNNINLDIYKDKIDISSYAINPMNWAIENKIISGIKADILSPKTGVTRAQMAVIIRNFIEKMNY